MANGVLDDIALPVFDQVEARNTIPGKRQPSLRESLDATIDRFVVLDELENIFADSASAIAYGGSMKYGPFMNVRSGADASDIDLVIFTEKELLDELDWRGVMETSLIDESDKLTFFARFSLQRALREAAEIDIMSQRFTLANKGYTISSHFMPMSFIEIAYPQDAAALQAGGDHHKYMLDYKERPFERPNVSNYDMTRRQHEIPVYNRAVKGGFIAANPAYSIIEGNYVPGMYQNLVLPTAKCAFDKDSVVTTKLGTFADVIGERERIERRADSRASVLNTEPRQSILPVDVGDILRA